MSDPINITEDLFFDKDMPAYRVVWNGYAHLAEFKVYEISGQVMDDGKYTPCFESEDCSHEEDFSKAAVHMHGSIKWDGCSNTAMSDRCMTHWCGQYNVSQHIELLKYLYNRAASIMGRESLDCGGVDPSWPIPSMTVREVREVIV